MIDLGVLHIDWINEASAKNNKADKILVEKVIRALLLLEGLSASGINFIFKGGTALMLMQGSTKRLSIDIDIIIPIKEDFEQAFAKIVKDKSFTRVELQERQASSNIEKAHYKFFYEPAYRTARGEEYVMLDILHEKPQYQQLASQNIDSTFVFQNGKPLQVQVPGFDDLLGDKLTAFAPNTTGIPYEKGGHSRAMEIIKQLYDIGNLVEQATNPVAITTTFHAFANTELGYRNIEADTELVLDDIFDTALTISTKGQLGNGNIEALKQGIGQLKQYIFSENYHIEKAVTHSARAAYITALIRTGGIGLQRFSEPMEIKDWNITNQQYNKLNKLRKNNPEAFYYWYQALTLLNLTEENN
ncbi:MAG: nucleotidyl transferase AbiEii/AbiGii toxin family protein [Chitinophagaceae bacterium]|nr:nucleotidyl transferase AbiEii/AbiGii toxin family protein [Chitinophagaceae bacterium]